MLRHTSCSAHRVGAPASQANQQPPTPHNFQGHNLAWVGHGGGGGGDEGVTCSGTRYETQQIMVQIGPTQLRQTRS